MKLEIFRMPEKGLEAEKIPRIHNLTSEIFMTTLHAVKFTATFRGSVVLFLDGIDRWAYQLKWPLSSLAKRTTNRLSRKSRGEEDEDFQILEYHAQKGNTVAMHKIGISYDGLRGVNCGHAKALSWFSKAKDKGEPRSLELLGEI
nr:ERAD-associated E3 ubiquitin-protein ligase component HRD3A-like [Tanacetum cinerariifolium]